MPRSSPGRPRLHVVTGKGGTGKTTVAAALALHLAEEGHRVLVAEVEGRGALAPLLGVAADEGVETPVASTAAGGELHVLGVDPRTALLEYLRLKVPVPAAAGVLTAVGAVDFAATVAPGVRDILVIGRVYEAAGRAGTGRRGPRYDVVVLDAPPTGRVARFLAAPEQVATVAQAGPVSAQAGRIVRWLRDRSVVHLVTLLEELPVEETVESVAELRAAGWSVGRVVVNLVDEEVVGAGTRAELESPDAAGALRSALAPSGLETTLTIAEALVRQLRTVVQEQDRRAGLRDRLAATGVRLTSLRRLPEAPDGGGASADLRALADQLGELT